MLNLSYILKMSLPKIVKDFIQSQSDRISDLLEQLWSKDKELGDLRQSLSEAEAELRRLKNLPKKPDLKPSNLDKPKQEKGTEEKGGKRAGSEKSKKKGKLEIHEQKKVEAQGVGADWIFKGYKPYVVQDMIVRANNIEYQREIWQSPDGKEMIIAELPAHLQGKHFGPCIQTYVLHQYYECAVSQGLIHRSLLDYGVQISSGQINSILTEGKEVFHQEKESLLSKAIELREELRTDDTGARHAFKNAYCNCINSDLFTYFSTSGSKSRINFLEILRQDRSNYELNEAAWRYLDKVGLSPKYCEVLRAYEQAGQVCFKDKEALEVFFDKHNWTAKYALKAITEALLIGTIVADGFDEQNLIHSDGAGQFDLFVHGLCWKHAERPLVKLLCYNEEQQTLLEDKMHAFWSLYQKLKDYKVKPDKFLISQLEKQFDELCQRVNNFAALNQVLDDLKIKKDKLLLVLKRPEASLHNNDSERDIREYVKRRKISAGTRSEKGKKARDTFLSLKKTCRKLGISFWDYLFDRVTGDKQLVQLSLIMQQRAFELK